MLDAPFIRTFIGSFINFVVLFITTPQEIITLRVTFARVAVAVAATAAIAIADQPWNVAAIASLHAASCARHTACATEE